LAKGFYYVIIRTIIISDLGMVKLSALKPGDSGVIAAVHSPEHLFQRLTAMGFRMGKRIELLRSAAFAGPLHVRIGTTEIALRRHVAQQIDLHPSSTE
jgi:ferrous iron transport protein A